MMFVFAGIFGWIAGLLAAAAWWSLAQLASGVAAPTDSQAVACCVIGAVVFMAGPVLVVVGGVLLEPYQK